MYAGIPMQKLSSLRALLERSGESMTDSSHLAAYIPKFEASELGTTIGELRKQKSAQHFETAKTFRFFFLSKFSPFFSEIAKET
jgi:hypothetical protein